MKKYSIIIVAGMIMCQNMYAISDKEIINQLNASATRYQRTGLEFFKNNVQTPESKQWDESFKKAKVFVIDKSKGFLRSQDLDIVKAMDIMEMVNDSIAYLATSWVGHTAPVEKLKSIRDDISKAMNMVAKSSRTEAKNVIIALGMAFTQFTQIIAQKLSMPPSRPLPPVPVVNSPENQKIKQLLNLPMNASDADVIAAYKKYALINHPDKKTNQTDQEKTRYLEISDLYERLFKYKH